eukprot:scaffold925_cov133-Isochrysis_galbana.AAC.4
MPRRRGWGNGGSSPAEDLNRTGFTPNPAVGSITGLDTRRRSQCTTRIQRCDSRVGGLCFRPEEFPTIARSGRAARLKTKLRFSRHQLLIRPAQPKTKLFLRRPLGARFPPPPCSSGRRCKAGAWGTACVRVVGVGSTAAHCASIGHQGCAGSASLGHRRVRPLRTLAPFFTFVHLCPRLVCHAIVAGSGLK